MFENLTVRTPLPSLNALRAFEAMARTGSATLAASELNVTHSAVSRQVKALEAQLGIRLFEGPRHALRLTRAGTDLLPGLTSAFDAMAAAVTNIRAEGQDLHIAVNASLSVKWLIPRLSDFNQRHPRIRIHLIDLPPHALSMRGADVILRLLTDEQLKSLSATIIIPNAIGPVMAPTKPDLAPKEALLRAPRLVSRTHSHGWKDWTKLSGQSLPPASERSVAHLHFALDAALSGWGAAVLPWALVARDLEEGLLIAPFGFVSPGGAVAAITDMGQDSRARRQFVNWLIEQGQAMPAPPFQTPI